MTSRERAERAVEKWEDKTYYETSDRYRLVNYIETEIDEEAKQWVAGIEGFAKCREREADLKSELTRTRVKHSHSLGEIIKLEDKLITAQSNNEGLSKENRRLRAANESLDEELRGRGYRDPRDPLGYEARIRYLESDNGNLRQQIHDAKHMRTVALDNSLVELKLKGQIKYLEDKLFRAEGKLLVAKKALG